MPKLTESGNGTTPESPLQKVSDPGAATPTQSMSSTMQSKPRAGPSAQGEAYGSEKQPLPGRKILERRGEYLITSRQFEAALGIGRPPLTIGLLEQMLQAQSGIEIVNRVNRVETRTAAARPRDTADEVPALLVARMTEQTATALQQQGQGRLLVERDQSLELIQPVFQQSPGATTLVQASIEGEPRATITVLGADNTPIKGVEVHLLSAGRPISGITDERGQVSLPIPVGGAETLQGLYVRPKTEYWSLYQSLPDLSTEEPNVVALRAISEVPSLANFLRTHVYGWGHKAMRLDQLPESYRGQGVKIAVIDSGCATSHDDLKNIRFGIDLVNRQNNSGSWNEDTVGHGTHCVGLIAGANHDSGIRGCAPDVEVHVCKVFPEGRLHHLIDALDYCIEHQIDIVNLNVSTRVPSEILEQQLLRARRAGILCIVPAGDSGGEVHYPASSPHVLSVSAIGKLHEFPDDCYEAQTIMPPVANNGCFSARFSCGGPEIGVCAPGVGIVSTAPSNSYAVVDGTYASAAYIGGLAALVLAHHSDFRTGFSGRNAERVERLAQAIKLSAYPLHPGVAGRSGVGLPDALGAIGLQSPAGLALQPGVPSPLTTSGYGGSALFNLMNASLMGHSAQSAAMVYPDARQSIPPGVFSSSWDQAGSAAPPAAAPMSGNFDPAYAGYLQAYFTQPQFNTGMQYAYGRPLAAFGRTGW